MAEKEAPHLDPAEHSAILQMYDHVRKDILSRRNNRHKKTTRGVALIGGIIAVAISQNVIWIISFVPFVLGIFVLELARSVRMTNLMVNYAIEIEEYVPSRLFNFESKYGGYYGDLSGIHGWKAWFNPVKIQFVLTCLFYLISVTTALYVWEPVSLYGVTITALEFGLLSIIYTFLIGMSVLSLYFQLD